MPASQVQPKDCAIDKKLINFQLLKKLVSKTIFLTSLLIIFLFIFPLVDLTQSLLKLYLNPFHKFRRPSHSIVFPLIVDMIRDVDIMPFIWWNYHYRYSFHNDKNNSEFCLFRIQEFQNWYCIIRSNLPSDSVHLMNTYLQILSKNPHL